MQQTTVLKEELARKAGRKKETAIQPVPISSINKKALDHEGIRLLRADEIECRVSTINVYGLRLLLYKDARVDQRILDEAFTPFGWKRTHQQINGNLYCTVEVWDDSKQQWISKQDVGTASYSDKEKGQASDSFKRACFNWGIGRELYTAPDIWIPAALVNIKENKDKKGHYVTSDRFSVHSIAYNEWREISGLVIVNQTGKEVFRMQQAQFETQQGLHTQAQTQQKNTDMQLDILYRELERTGITLETVLERYKIQDISQMTPEIYSKALNGLRKTQTKEIA